jgi:hypothetical protein
MSKDWEPYKDLQKPVIPEEDKEHNERWKLRRKMEIVTKMKATALLAPQVDFIFAHWIAENYPDATLETSFTLHDMQKAFHAGFVTLTVHPERSAKPEN